jgi:hypothetical protein
MSNKIEINNPSTLFDFLATQCQKLDEKKITIEQAKAQASLAKQMNNVMQFRLDKARFEHNAKVTIHKMEQDAIG